MMLFFLLPAAGSLVWQASSGGMVSDWSEARRDSSGQAPDPAVYPEAVLQIYAARAFGWRGGLGVHTWIAYKAAGAPVYTRMEVVGWGVRRGYPAVRIRRGVPDGYWYGSYPTLLGELRGESAGRAYIALEAAAARYPHAHEYTLWPGPNSNTFVAYLARQVPELRLDLPANAIGKDYLPGGAWWAPAPSGTGYQFSLRGVVSVMLAREEGLEVSLLGLTWGIDLRPPALKLPGFGRLGLPAA